MNLLKCFGMENCAPKLTPMNDKIQLDIEINNVNLTDDFLSETNKECYQQKVESLLYLSLETRSDIFFVVAILS